jgi:hypothetical protein
MEISWEVLCGVHKRWKITKTRVMNTCSDEAPESTGRNGTIVGSTRQ